MSKKLMLLALGALTALAMTALPSAASAGEFEATCEGGGTCTGTVESTGHAVLEDDSGLKITCVSTTGSATATDKSKTGTVQLLFHKCTETVFHTECHSTFPAPVQPAGTITTGVMVTHNIYIHPNQVTPGVLVTGASVTFRCPIVNSNKTVTGNVIGDWESNIPCKTASLHHTVEFLGSATKGTQKYEQVTTSGPLFDLIVATSNGPLGTPHDLTKYTTASQLGTAHINWNKKVTLDC